MLYLIISFGNEHMAHSSVPLTWNEL